jgi:serine/threonine protein kinase
LRFCKGKGSHGGLLSQTLGLGGEGAVEQSPAIFDNFYEIVRELGRGTTGTVYEARHTRLNRRYALKVPALLPDAEGHVKVQRFFRECQALAHLTGGPDCNIPRLCVVAENAAGQPYSLRDLVDGSTLEQRVSDLSIDLRSGLAVVAEVARVVQWVHGQGFAHRNLSGANVLVAMDGTPWLVGFGRVGLLVGSPMLPAGAAGTPAEVDVRGLQDLLRWLCGALRNALPAGLDRVCAPDAVATAGAFASAVVSHQGCDSA